MHVCIKDSCDTFVKQKTLLCHTRTWRGNYTNDLDLANPGNIREVLCFVPEGCLAMTQAYSLEVLAKACPVAIRDLGFDLRDTN